jgi:hypothetical protein
MTSRGRAIWSAGSIATVLKNPVYAGRVATLRYEKIEPTKRRKNTFGKTSFRIKPENEWHYIEGIVDRPIITWEQHLAIRDRLKLNWQYAVRNARHDYLARGLIECQLCHRHYYGVRPTSGRPKYVCSKSWGISYGEKCTAKALDQEDVDTTIRSRIRSFLENPRAYAPEVQAQATLLDRTKEDIERSIKHLEKDYRDTIDDECSALRLSAEAFKQKQTMILLRRSWLVNEIKSQKEKLAGLERLRVTQQTIEAVRARLQSNLNKATYEDWRVVIEALGTKVLSFGDGTWDIEINVPVDISVVNSTPWYISPD